MTNQASFFSIPSEVLPRRLRGVGQSVMVCMGAVSSVICLVTNGALMCVPPARNSDRRLSSDTLLQPEIPCRWLEIRLL